MHGAIKLPFGQSTLTYYMHLDNCEFKYQSTWSHIKCIGVGRCFELGGQ